jgi:hypothetical protein
MTSVRIASIVAALFAFSPAAFAGDPVVESFDRMLAHAPSASASVSPDADRTDPVALAIRTAVGKQPAAPRVAWAATEDPALAAFQRMFEHTPTHVPAPIPAADGPDPLIAAVVLPLLRSGHVQVVGHPHRHGG